MLLSLHQGFWGFKDLGFRVQGLGSRGLGCRGLGFRLEELRA